MAYVLYVKTLYVVVRIAVCVAYVLRMLCVYVECTYISELLFNVGSPPDCGQGAPHCSEGVGILAVSCQLHSSDAWSLIFLV